MIPQSRTVNLASFAPAKAPKYELLTENPIPDEVKKRLSKWKIDSPPERARDTSKDSAHSLYLI
jgi:hypothetical protein